LNTKQTKPSTVIAVEWVCVFGCKCL